MRLVSITSPDQWGLTTSFVSAETMCNPLAALFPWVCIGKIPLYDLRQTKQDVKEVKALSIP